MNFGEFNRNLQALVNTAVQDNEMGLAQIIGSLEVAKLTLDHRARVLASQRMAREAAKAIVPATILPTNQATEFC